MGRRETLLEIVQKNKEIAPVLEPMIEEMLFLEPQLDELKKLPFLRVHPDKPWLQKATPAAKQYKELLQQYINVVKAVQRELQSGEEDTCPLQEWLHHRMESDSHG